MKSTFKAQLLEKHFLETLTRIHELSFLLIQEAKSLKAIPTVGFFYKNRMNDMENRVTQVVNDCMMKALPGKWEKLRNELNSERTQELSDILNTLFGIQELGIVHAAILKTIYEDTFIPITESELMRCDFSKVPESIADGFITYQKREDNFYVSNYRNNWICGQHSTIIASMKDLMTVYQAEVGKELEILV